jgi:hypothetical protein
MCWCGTSSSTPQMLTCSRLTIRYETATDNSTKHGPARISPRTYLTAAAKCGNLDRKGVKMPSFRLFVLLALVSTGASTGAHAQWLNYPTPGTPRTPDGKPNLTAPAPRVADGKPDLSGVWHAQPTPLAEWKVILNGDLVDAGIRVNAPGNEFGDGSKYAFNILLDFKPEEVPIRPEASEILRRRRVAGELPPVTECLPAGISIANLAAVTKVVQSPGLTLIMYEEFEGTRQIYIDGRELPKEVVQPSWLGYSVGKWDGDTLVVETFNDKTWLDAIGHPQSEALRIVERYRRRDFGHMDVEMTFDDRTLYTTPFTIKFTQDLLADSDVFEYFCNENEKDRGHIGKK